MRNQPIPVVDFSKLCPPKPEPEHETWLRETLRRNTAILAALAQDRPEDEEATESA